MDDYDDDCICCFPTPSSWGRMFKEADDYNPSVVCCDLILLVCITPVIIAVSPIIGIVLITQKLRKMRQQKKQKQ